MRAVEKRKRARVAELVEQVCQRIRGVYPEVEFEVAPELWHEGPYLVARIDAYTNADIEGDSELDVIDLLLPWLDDVLIEEEIDIMVQSRSLSQRRELEAVV